MLYQRIDEKRLRFGLLLVNKYLFAKYFWRDELSRPMSVKQKMMFCDTSKRQLYCTGRGTGKTTRLEAYYIQSIVTKTSSAPEEYLFDVPSQVHLEPVRKRILRKIHQVPLFANLVKNENNSSGIYEYINNCTWHTRIEGNRGGINVIGLHVKKRVGDEGAYSHDDAYLERQSCLLPGCEEIWAGVPNGIRGTYFYKLDQTVEGIVQGWNRHHLTSYDNPINQSEEVRRKLIADHGGENSQNYITQVLGEWGAEASSSFPPSHLYIEVDTHKHPYLVHEGVDEQVVRVVEEGKVSLDNFFAVPQVRAHNYVIGADIGFSPDPTIIFLDYEQQGVWYSLVKVKLIRVIDTHQACVIDSLCRQVDYKVRVICIDQTGGFGKAIAQALVSDERFNRKYTDDMISKPAPILVTNANFGGSIDDGTRDEQGKLISKGRKQFSTELLQSALMKQSMSMR